MVVVVCIVVVVVLIDVLRAFFHENVLSGTGPVLLNKMGPVLQNCDHIDLNSQIFSAIFT